MLTKASFSMTRNIRKNIPLVTRVDDNCWTIRGQLPFPQGLHFIYNQFAAKHVADIFSHPFFMEPEYWPEQPSPQFHLTEEMQSCMLVVKGMIHMRDVTTHLDNTMVLCRNPHDHTEFGIYNPSHVEEQTLAHVQQLIEGCGVEPQSLSSSETFSMSAAYGSGQGVDKQRMNSTPQLPSPGSSRSGGGMGMSGMNAGSSGGGIGGMGRAGTSIGDNAGGGGLHRSGPPRMGTVKQVLEAERKRKLQNSLHHSSQRQDQSAAGEDNQTAQMERMDKYGHMFQGRKPIEGMVEGDPRLYSDEPWRDLANRDPEDQLPPEFREKLRREREQDAEMRAAVGSKLSQSATDKELFELYKKEQEERRIAEEQAKSRKGKLKWIVVPTRQTWQALEIWRSRFPDAIVHCSGNIPAYLTKEGKERGVLAPTAFSLPTAFTPHEPTPAPHEGTESSGIMMSAGGHGAKGGASLKGKNNNKNEAGGSGNDDDSSDFLARKFNPMAKGTAKSGTIKDAAGKWHKPQIDLTRTKIEFFEKEGHEKHQQQQIDSSSETNNNDSNNNNNNNNNNNSRDSAGVGETFNNVSMSADPSSIRRQRDYEKMKEMKILDAQEQSRNDQISNEQQQHRRHLTLGGLIAEASATSQQNRNVNTNTSSTATPVTSPSSGNIKVNTSSSSSSTQVSSSLIADLDAQSQLEDAHEVPHETIQVPKLENSSQELADAEAEADEADDENPYEVISNPTPIDGVQVLPRDGAVVELFDGAFNLIRVNGDPRTNEFVLYQKDSGLLACTDLFHGSYTDFDPMNTWLVRVWGKFQRGGLYKDAGLLPAFRLNQLKSYPSGGLARVQRFVDDLTRGLAEKLKILVYAHGTGPMIVPTDLLSKQQLFEERMAQKQQQTKDRESTQLLQNMMKTNVDGTDVLEGNNTNSDNNTNNMAQSVYTKTFIADALRSQYGLASLEEADEAVRIFGLHHPVTLKDLNRVRIEQQEKKVETIEDHFLRNNNQDGTHSVTPALRNEEGDNNNTNNLSEFVSDYRHQQHDGVVRHRPPPKEFTDQENISEDEVMRTQYVRPKF